MGPLVCSLRQGQGQGDMAHRGQPRAQQDGLELGRFWEEGVTWVRAVALCGEGCTGALPGHMLTSKPG